jgi:hypothetical protein
MPVEQEEKMDGRQAEVYSQDPCLLVKRIEEGEKKNTHTKKILHWLMKVACRQGN